MIRRIPLALAALAVTAVPAFAHLNPEEHGSFMAGFSHPLFGLDHILVMVAVGLWAAQIGGKALWGVPAAFVTTMAVGFGLALAGIDLPFVEPAILASVVALGLLVAMAVKLDTAASAAIVATFALFHGHAHGGELGSAGAFEFGVGFVVATALLHIAGIGFGLGIARLSGGAIAARILGAITALTGLVLAFG
ncbi:MULTISPECIES: HupE/UreJ family protein [unclassified Shinella]|jgi:urease accessory protein|uniref:HupE/UreJ family protein n=1 Tax=unclassified Shinella TaxID=2643062 RepID=UPI000682B1A7|nr:MULTISPECIES: HupE/UreJ family protein [unclassified Shinella]KNY16609.1 protein hupE [Shinella sp. SUS2]KOC77132.1 protein hupE [Shinella sp. GWS1]MCO5150992.1 HupE/UreJ family protein [Shinella sp.]MDC7262998.1 HupE/UreJ family protein [Shinella sp. HY16]MDC7269893.1 HupE/UreJ family protein [Shinella sp. YZ44]